MFFAPVERTLTPEQPHTCIFHVWSGPWGPFPRDNRAEGGKVFSPLERKRSCGPGSGRAGPLFGSGGAGPLFGSGGAQILFDQGSH